MGNCTGCCDDDEPPTRLDAADFFSFPNDSSSSIQTGTGSGPVRSQRPAPVRPMTAWDLRPGSSRIDLIAPLLQGDVAVSL